MARARLEIDLDAVLENWRALDARSGPKTETGAVLKANAYGLGLAPVARALSGAGVRTFFVALAEEGAELREVLGPAPQIVVLSGLMPGDAPLCRKYNLTVCLNSLEQVLEFKTKLKGHPCAIQVDSGMNRLGLESDDLDALLAEIPGIKPAFIMSHLACADETEHPMNMQQNRAFRALAKRSGIARRSLAATGGILLGARFHYDLCRPGVGLFGGEPFATAKPVVNLSLPVIQVRDVVPGETVGYGASWRANSPTRIATLSAGYADGLLRRIGDRRIRLYSGDIPCPMAGRISMDLITVKVTNLKTIPTHLEILNRHQTVDDLARIAGTIGYEILTALGDRYERIYKGAVS